MIKRILASAFVILTLITKLAAQDFTVNNLKYSINYDGVSVTLTGHVDGHEASGNLVIPEMVTYDGSNYSVTKIKEWAFEACFLLTGSLVIPNSVTTIGEYAFSRCGGITDLSIGESVIHIDNEAFFQCTGMTGDLIIPNSVESIGDNAFQGCTGFDGELLLGNSLKGIGNGAFEGCNGLHGSLVIPNSVTTIGELAFSDCHGFTNPLVIGCGVKSIGLDAFLYMDYGLTQVYILAAEPPIVGQSLFEALTTHYLTVPCGSLESYQNSGWNKFFKTISEDCEYQFAPQGAEWYYNRVAVNNETLGYSRSYVAGYDTIQSHSCKRIKHTFLVENDEFMYDNDGTVYWYNPKIDAFTVLYKFNAKSGDRWVSRIEDHVYEITVQSEEYYIWNEHSHKILNVVAHDLEQTWKYYYEKIICGIGYDTGLVPYHWPYENLLFESQHIDYLRCYMEDGDLLYHHGDYDCDYIPDIATSFPVLGTEWYYEIINGDGSITYQYLECAADTTIGTTRPKVIVKSNTLYDKGLNIVKTHEYVYSDNGVVYWRNKLSGSYTTLYNFNANVGDEWIISVGNQSITMHVDAVNYTEYNGNVYRIMTVSDENDIFGGDIICGIGHTRSFFPEKLLSKDRNYRVDGMHCYWVDGEPIIQFGDVDCDEIYKEYHQTTPPSDNKISVYPNPAYDFILINVKQPTHYTISDIFGKTILKGIISSDNQQIDISELSYGMYFIKIGSKLEKFIKN